MGVLGLSGGRKIRGQATEAVYEITVLEGYANVKDLTGVIAVTLGVTAKAATLSLTDTVE
jgi:hypothetical protein